MMDGMRGCFLAMLLLTAIAATASLPPDFPALFSDVSGLVDTEDPGALEMAEGAYKATRLFSVGPEGVPQVTKWFVAAGTRGEAGIGGLYLSVHGGLQDRMVVRRELERNRSKRSWVWSIVGSERAFFESLESGRSWVPLMRVLPSVDGCRQLSHLLMASPDLLTRRSGMYWGYWTADAKFWTRVRELAQTDPDRATRKLAERLDNMSRHTGGGQEGGA